jgi:putative membrane-bound dehydrogenase-like protein
MKHFQIRFVIFAIISSAVAGCSTKDKVDERSPESSLADLKVYNGLEVTLFASEPMMTNPTNMDIDALGRVWVCEAYNYRSQYNPKNPTKKDGDRILILEDTDGDGKADKQKVFYQGTDINSALGICVLGDKIIVSCSPNVLVFTDSNGDDKPDKKEILFKGVQGVQHDHGIHAFTFGPDGLLYFNMGNEGKSLVQANGDTVVDIHGRKVVTNGKPFREGLVLRCQPDGSHVEVLGSNFRNNYEVAVDPYGTLWQSDNDDDGNKGTRINYVMEYGNYGYKDEMTGASWGSRRTNMEKEIPLRHWHLNDPGVVPNLLQTGSGSPTGMAIYEGSQLPGIFHGQMIHAEAGHNVVRSYPVQNDGAGYKATIVNILEGQKDQWFRPSDVAIAPDGSLFVADWYDPGVGGHQVGDLDRGRIYRVAPPKSSYSIPGIDLSTPAEAAHALISPNSATRYLGWTTLAKYGNAAENDLLKLWDSSNPRHRAQAFWLLIKLKGKEDVYISKGLSDPDPNIRIMALRAARELGKDIIPLASQLVKDTSAQVRREVLLGIRGNTNPQAAQLWATLAMDHTGSDRWYLEALGISAQGNEHPFFAAWLTKVGQNWNTAGGRDIIWRSRSKAAMPLLAEIIKKSDEKEMLRYYRAFDFQADPSKEQVLIQLALQTQGQKVLYALKHMNASKVKMTPALNVAINKVLEQYKGKIEFVDLVSSFKIANQAPELLSLTLTYPDSLVGKESAKDLVEWGRTDLLQEVIKSKKKNDLQALIKALRPHMYNPKAIALMEQIMNDSTQDLENRKLAVRAFRGPMQSEDRLLQLAKEKKIPEVLHASAAGVFQTTWRQNLRTEAAQYLKMPGSKEGSPLPNISTLAEKTGDVEKGKLVFDAYCATCHQINGAGTNFGPALSEIGGKLPKEGIYTAILYPDQGISFGFEGYRFTLKDGSEAIGMISSETTDKIELKYMASQQTINKADVVSKVKMENSLMPSNLQSSMSEQELVDLVEYLGGLKKSSAN